MSSNNPSPRRLSPWVLGLLLAFSRGAGAQPSSVQKAERPALLLQQSGARDATTSSPLSAPETVVSLEASREAKEITAKLGWQVGDLVVDLKFKGPIGEQQPSAALATLDGLADGVSADLGVSHLLWNPQLPADFWRICEDNNRGLTAAEVEAAGGSEVKESDIAGWPDFITAIATCSGLPGRPDELAKTLAARGQRTPSDEQALLKALNEALHAPEATPVLAGRVVVPLPPSVADLLRRSALTPGERLHLNRQLLELALKEGPDEPLMVLRPAGPPCMASKLSASSRQRMLAGAKVGHAVWLGARAKSGRTDLEYADVATLEPLEKTRYGFALSASVGILTPLNRFFALGVKHEVSHRPAADPVEICRPYKGSPNFTCSEMSVGEPTRESRILGYFEFRTLVAKKFALGPQIFHDFRNGRTALNVPLYFLSSDKGLNGGLVFKWAEGKKFSASLFVGNVFALTGGS